MNPKLLCAVAASLGLAALSACGSSDAAAPQRFAIGIDHSSFSPEREMTFSRGDIVTFVIRNDDPIDHEFILGDQAVQDRHEEGRQRHHHGVVPGEISVPAGETATTTYTFSKPGTLIYACHLPGHFNYGMHGTVEID